MDSIVLERSFPGHRNVANGVRQMIQLWEDGSRTVKFSDPSFSFYYAKGHCAFRVETAVGGRLPRLVIYAGTNDLRRGSPLLKGANAKRLQKLEIDFGICEDKKGKSRWLKLLREDTPLAFYSDFTMYTLENAPGVLGALGV